jgi:hypothetical protein
MLDYLRTITASWSTPFAGEIWTQLESCKRSTSKNGDAIVLGLVLPDDQEPRLAELTVHRDAEQEIHWSLSVLKAPEVPPPKAVVAQSEKLGGRCGLENLMKAGLPAGTPAVGLFRVRVMLPEARFACPTLPTAALEEYGHGAALTLGQEVRLEQVGYRFQGGGALGLEEVALVYLHRSREYAVIVTARGPLKLGSPTWLPFATDAAELAVSAFFSPREETP